MILSDVKDILSYENSIAGEYIKKYEYPWETLPHIKDIISNLGETLSSDYIKKTDNIWIHKTAKVSEKADISGPAIICEGAEIRPGAYIRGTAIIGKNAVLGNSCEIKNSIMFDGVQAPHFNYIGDSILGYKAHVGAGVIISNLRLDKKNVVLKFDDVKYESGLRKFGAILGDLCEIGCNSVLNPGTVLENGSFVYPLTSV